DRAGTYGPEAGMINYGAMCLDQRVHVAEPKLDFMQTWSEWLRVQNGYDKIHYPSVGQKLTGDKRFIYTLRDLATYVHVDQLYQPYLNACLILLEMGAPLDPSFGKLGGHSPHYHFSAVSQRNAGGFALYGGPHVLTLVTEVATRALKAVRFQKFNNHIRCRPEALAARMEKAEVLTQCYPSICDCLERMCNGIEPTIKAIRGFNSTAVGQSTALLPMAFEEGSPMHPAYGAGHATVAGACVTMLKAFFDTGAIFGEAGGEIGFHKSSENVTPLQVEAMDSGETLRIAKLEGCPLSLEGELNKLAANIAIGRNMAGVHYFSDYYDSLRMGEQIALGILEEQALCYPQDPFVVSVPTFDGGIRRIGKR
ncbi:MAG: vanadium-dependent haloperoxidase, partial [Cellvibrionaceae bacterium]|nr:vanadium-dependent haloperoxidase [Cellvibrionaceae bacterium]